MARKKRANKPQKERSSHKGVSRTSIKRNATTGGKSRAKKRLTNGVVSSKIVEEQDVQQLALHPNLCSKLSNFKSSWNKGKSYKEDIIDVEPLPFKHCVINRVLKDDSFLDDVCRELSKLPHNQMLNDLYSCHQACLLDVDSSYPAVNNLVKFIKGPLRMFVQDVTGKKFSNKFTITASQYKFTDRLLCHDDNLHDRSVAFIFYLCKNWEKKFGGSLDLFSCDSDNQPDHIVKSIFPSFGSFAFFEVTHNSYHQVSEVLTSKHVRLSINGWYHGEPLPEQTVWPGVLPKMLPPIQPRGCSVDNFLNSTWLDAKTHDQVKSSFEKELSISLAKFLKPSVFEDLENALKDESIVWESCGPANHKQYQVAKLSNLPNIISKYLKFIQSKQWFRLLSKCTVEISPDVKPAPKCWFEVQKWQPGNYTVLVDNDPLNESTGIDVHLYFGVEKRRKNQQGGEVFYLGPDRDEDGNLEQAFHLEPESNTATIIAHIEGMAVLTKYLDHRNKSFYKIFARYSQSLD